MAHLCTQSVLLVSKVTMHSFNPPPNKYVVDCRRIFHSLTSSDIWFRTLCSCGACMVYHFYYLLFWPPGMLHYYSRYFYGTYSVTTVLLHREGVYLYLKPSIGLWLVLHIFIIDWHCSSCGWRGRLSQSYPTILISKHTETYGP